VSRSHLQLVIERRGQVTFVATSLVAGVLFANTAQGLDYLNGVILIFALALFAGLFAFGSP
jgi:hypothetical protein